MRFLKQKAVERSALRRYGSRADAWGRGFIDNAIYRGIVGEHAVAIYLSREDLCRLIVDVSLRRDGDGGRDLEVAGLGVIQVKTRGRDYGDLLIRRVDDRKCPRPLECDVFVAAQWELDSSDVALIGWIWAHDASVLGVMQPARAKGAKHWNLVVPDCELLPMRDLRAEIEARRQVVA